MTRVGGASGRAALNTYQDPQKEPCLGLEIIDIRHFTPIDFSPLLAAESRAWHDELYWDFASSARVITNCLHEKRLSGYALVSSGKIQGYCFFFYDGSKGLIGDLFVDRKIRDAKHTSRLLEHILETLLGTPGLRRVEAQLPHFSLDQLEPFFAAHHFKAYLRRFMLLTLDRGSNSSAPWLSAAKGSARTLDPFEVVLWERKHDRDASELLLHTYHDHVDAVINDQYTSLNGTARLLENVIHHQGCGEFLPRVSRVAVHRPSQKLAGILAVTAVRKHTAHIPQIAVAEEFQGCRVGTTLMETAFRDLIRRGFQEVSLTVTDANDGAVRLYERIGFKTFRDFGAFVFVRH